VWVDWVLPFVVVLKEGLVFQNPYNEAMYFVNGKWNEVFQSEERFEGIFESCLYSFLIVWGIEWTWEVVPSNSCDALAVEQKQVVVVLLPQEG